MIPAFASTIPSKVSPDTFFILVSMFPRIGLTITSGLRLLTCTARRSELVPITAPALMSSKDELSNEIKISFAASRFGIHAKIRVASSSVGTSLRLCTAKSTSFCATALSISFSKIPFWSIVNNGLLSVSPFVVMVLISYSESGFTLFSSAITQFV